MKKEYHKSPVSWIIPVGLVLLLAVALLSCNTEAKQLRKTQEYLFKHPDYSAGYCAEQYPVKDSIAVRDSIRLDTLTVEYHLTDTVTKDGQTTYVDRLIPAKTIVKYIRHDSIIYRRDYAQERRLQMALDAAHGNISIMLAKNTYLENQVAEWKAKAKKRWWIIFIIIGAMIGIGAYKIYRRFKPQLPKLKF